MRETKRPTIQKKTDLLPNSHILIKQRRLKNSLNSFETGNQFQFSLLFSTRPEMLKKNVEAVSLVKGVKEKEKRIRKNRKMGREREKKMKCQ